MTDELFGLGIVAAMPPPVSPELIDKLNKLATYLTEQGEYEAVDLIDTVVARLMPAGDGWMPIETAPKDGTRVLLMLRGPKPPEMIARWTQAWTSEDDDLLEWINDEEDTIYGTPTHWHPLPAPPAAEDPRP